MSVGVFSNRETIVVFDDPPPTCVQAWIAIQRRPEQMARSAIAEKTHVQRIAGIGWQLESYFSNWADGQMLTAARSGILSQATGSLVLAPGHSENPGWAQFSGPGVSYSGDIEPTGGPFAGKDVAADEDFAKVLAADQAAYPSPVTSEDYTDLDRVAISTGLHEPWEQLQFTILLPGAPLGSVGSFATIMFCGPAGVDKVGKDDPTKAGTGQYALKMRFDGSARLYERLADASWQRRFIFNWGALSTSLGWTCASVRIATDCYQDAHGEFHGSRIVFTAGFGGGTGVVQNLISTLQVLANPDQGFAIYNVPKVVDAATTLTPIRIDAARDARPRFQVAKHRYYTSGVLYDDVISLDQPITLGEPIYLYYKGVYPPGTNISARMIDPTTGDDLTVESEEPYGQYWVVGFTPVERMRHVRIRFAYTGDGAHTPTLQDVGIYRSAIYASENPLTPIQIPMRQSPPALPQVTISELQIEDQQTDPGNATFSLRVEDLTGQLAQIENRAMVPVRVMTRYDENPEHLAWLATGYALTMEQDFHRPDPDREYPSPNYKTFDIQGVGEWARLQENFVQRRYTWADPETGEPFKVSTIARTLLQSAYPGERVIVPDRPLRIFSADSDAYVMEPGTRIGDGVKSTIEDFAGSYLTYCGASGSGGAWRVLEQKTPPYNDLAIFERDHPGLGKLPHISAAYGSSVVGSQTVVHTYIKAKTYHRRVERAEGNLVTGYGSGLGNDAAKQGAGDAALLTQVAVMVDSFNWLGLRPGDAGYPDGSSPEWRGGLVPIRATDFRCTTQQAIDWRVRRIFDRACWVREFVTFEAPMVAVTDVTDPYQSIPRALRFYDSVLVRQADDSLKRYLVWKCSPAYVKGHVQMARFVLVRQGNIDDLATMPTGLSPFDSIRKAISRVYSRSPHAPHGYGSQNAGDRIGTETMTLPELTSNPIQDLDPTSATYGKFWFLPGYSEPGGGDPLWGG